MKILIADDDAGVRSLLRLICAKLRAEVRDCGDGTEAIRIFSEFRPDWTIMDLDMPRLDGLCATREIVAAHPGARIVMLTHHDGANYEQAAREAGASVFMVKPYLTPLLDVLSAPKPSQNLTA